MRGKILSLTIIILMVIGSYGVYGTNTNLEEETDYADFVPGEIILGFHKENDILNQGFETSEIKSLDVNNIETFGGFQIKEKISSLNVGILEVPEGKEEEYITHFSSYKSVKYAQPNYIYRALEFIPNDPKWKEQWGPKRIKCPEAWEREKGSTTVTIAIIDTGVDADHEDLVGRVRDDGKNHVGGSGTDDVYGHGTHCAGIAAAKMNNDVGVAGVSQVKILPEKVLGDTGSGSSSSVASGIDHAREKEVEVISMSLGGGGYDETLKGACDAARNAGILLFAASGNDYSLSGVSYPARYDSVIAVGAIDQSNNRCSFSNGGPNLELMAPGANILSTKPNNNYVYHDGTSMACPHAAGVAALAVSYGLSNIRQNLQDTAVDLGSSGRDNTYGYGLVDASALLGGAPPDGEFCVDLSIYRISNENDKGWGTFENIDWPGSNTPEWYYQVKLTEPGYQEQIHKKFNRNDHDLSGEYSEWWWDWNHEFTWDDSHNEGTVEVARDHKFFRVSTTGDVAVQINLWDQDTVESDDQADLSPTSNRRFKGTYNLLEDKMYDESGKEMSIYGENCYSSIGNQDDNARVWFKISDNYQGPHDARIDCDVNTAHHETSFSGSVKGGAEPFDWYWEFGDGTTDDIQDPVHTYKNPGEKTVKLTVTDRYGNTAKDTKTITVEENKGPSNLKISGQFNGEKKTTYKYTFSASDPEGDKVKYYVKWGDGDTYGWTELDSPGWDLTKSHSWDRGEYTITFMAEDELGAKTSKTQGISMPKSISQTPLISQILKLIRLRFLIFFSLLVE